MPRLSHPQEIFQNESCGKGWNRIRTTARVVSPRPGCHRKADFGKVGSEQGFLTRRVAVSISMFTVG
jgi:hypothetical protein